MAVVVNIGMLAAVKYGVFLSGLGIGAATSFSEAVLPLGISFYTFQLLAYQIDVSRDPSIQTHRLAPFSLFIIFFRS